VDPLQRETNDRVIRIAPPLLISRDGVDWAFERITKLIGKSRVCHVVQPYSALASSSHQTV
jgi:acetylornithine/succinyldiaminopimelate/putrescine aminotransferase